MFTRIACLALAYAAATTIFIGAAVSTNPKAPAIAMSSVALEKTNRANIGSPDSFVAQRFAG